MRLIDNIRSWTAEQRCQELLDALGVDGDTFDEERFLARVGDFAGGKVSLARLDQDLWGHIQDEVPGHMSGISTPYPGGWMILLPAQSIAHDSTVIGHEAGHILFGDVPHWERSPDAHRRAVENWRDGENGDAVEMLPRSALRVRTDSRREARAERFGALLTARLELGHAPPRDPVDRFFQVGEV